MAFKRSSQSKSGSIKIRMVDNGRFDKLLGKIELEMRNKALRKAVKRASRIVEQEAKRLAPKPGYEGDKPGRTALKDTIGVSVKEYRGGRVYVGIIGPRRPAGNHAHLVEFGTKPHRIRPKDKKALRIGGRFIGEAKHPGAKAKPFMRPAADKTKRAQRAAFIWSLRADIREAGR